MLAVGYKLNSVKELAEELEKVIALDLAGEFKIRSYDRKKDEFIEEDGSHMHSGKITKRDKPVDPVHFIIRMKGRKITGLKLNGYPYQIRSGDIIRIPIEDWLLADDDAEDLNKSELFEVLECAFKQAPLPQNQDPEYKHVWK